MLQVSTGTGTIVGVRTPVKTSKTTCCCSSCVGLECLDRTRYFAGQLLTDADLSNDQSYYLAKNRLHNRYLQGWGVVCGLQVLCSECNDGTVTVKAGYAIDPCGNDIIVCADQSFNVVKAILACCKPPAASNCSPLRSSPPATCQDAEQQWCVTVQYLEQPTRMVTSLQPTGSTSSSGSGKSTCGCGCGSNGNGSNGNSMSSSSCSCGSSQAATSTATTGSCEPTRIVEGFQFGVCACDTFTTNSQAGTILSAIQQCGAGLVQFVLQGVALVQGQPTYQATCNFVMNVQQYFLQNQTLTNCVALNKLNKIRVKEGDNYTLIVTEVLEILVQALLDCVCVSLLPQCPPDPCDNRVPLACVTVKNGVVTNICEFECRKQLIGYTALRYWLEPLFSGIKTVVDDLLKELCCGALRLKRGYYPSKLAFEHTNVTTAAFTNSAMFTHAVSTFAAQKMGATLLNAINPNLRAVDVRPVIGKTRDEVLRTLVENKTFTENQLYFQDVSDDPAWIGSSDSAPQFAPAAVSAGQPLTLYMQNGVVAGVEVTSPTDDLQRQIKTLSSQMNDLQNQLGDAQNRINQFTAATNVAAPAQPAPAPSTKKKS